MDLNANFAQRVLVHAAQLAWQDSPMPGVQRRMLDRMGDEVARATTIVRYAPGSQFSEHVHTGGEEFLVLEGVFQDEHGDFPVGSYVRNPPGTRHTPSSAEGCVIFVKLWQFDQADHCEVGLQTQSLEPLPALKRTGVRVAPLHQDVHETVQLEYWAPDAQVHLDVYKGAELLVLEGGFTESQDQLVAQSWLRLPANSTLNAVAGSQGAVVWAKYDHLAEVVPPSFAR